VTATQRRVAVIGSGVAGLTAAHVASATARVTLFEADHRPGGHADTQLIDGLAIDTGFIVHNERTYPTLMRLFADLGVETQDSEMSLSTRDDGSGLEWAGALGFRGLFPTWHNLARPAYLRMLTEIPRFHRAARALLAAPATRTDLTLRDFVRTHRFTPYFVRHFLEPLVAAVWSCDPRVALDYPARYLFAFLDHHGMLTVFGSPQWRTVVGGSREYVGRVIERCAEVHLGTRVVSVVEDPEGVELRDDDGRTSWFDAVVVATHPDQALSLLAEPTETQKEVLGALPYTLNEALLHTDESVLPRARRARASWNFHRPVGPRRGITVTYDLTRLMRLTTSTRYLLTLGGRDLVDPERVLARREYAHPLYNPDSVAARARLTECNTERVVFAGAYHGWGFHEDGARSGAAAAERLGLHWPSSVGPRLPTTPALYRTTVTHTRRGPWLRRFQHRSWLWLVDLDHVPDHGRRSGLLGRFEARDHLGPADGSLRGNVTDFLAQHGITLGTASGTGRVLLAAHPRALGHCFNPISVFWCFDGEGRPAATVVEVHNTYGDRHAYLLHPDAQGRAATDKQLYVSPFHGVDGHYELAVPPPGPDGRLDLAVTLHASGAPFSARLTGRRIDGASASLAAWRAAPASLVDSALIKAHGIVLWARGLPVRPRPAHHQAGVQ